MPIGSSNGVTAEDHVDFIQQTNALTPQTEPMDVHVIRHGSTAMNSDTSTDRMRGWGDIPLSAEGKEESKATAQEMKGEKIKYLFHSDLQRATHTAQDISGTTGAQMVPIPELRTWHIGDLEGMLSDEANPIMAQYATRTPDVPLPGGESFNEFKDRAISGVEKANAIANGEPYGIVTHHKTERVLNAWVKNGMPEDNSINAKEFLAEGEEPGSIQKLPLGKTPIIKNDIPIPKQITDALKAVGYALVPSALRPLSDEERTAIEKQRQDTTKPGKIPEAKSLAEMNPLGAGLMGGLDIASNLIPGGEGTSKSIFLGLGGMKRLLGNAEFKNTTKLASELAAKLEPRVSSGALDPKRAADLIRERTGISFGADDLPRLEISDKGSKINEDILSKLSTDKPVKLGDLLDHPELYKAHPELRDFPVFKNEDPEKAGSYQHSEGNIVVTPGTPEEVRSTLLHEIQHYIQYREGHAVGGNPNMYQPPGLDPLVERLTAASTEVLKDLKSKGVDPVDAVSSVKALDQIGDNAKESNKYWVNGQYRTPFEIKRIVDKVEATGHLDSIRKMIDTNNDLDRINAFKIKQYKKLAGEQEATNVEARKDYGPSEIRDVPPEVTETVPRDQQELRFHTNDPAFSMDPRSQELLEQRFGKDFMSKFERKKPIEQEVADNPVPKGAVDNTERNRRILQLAKDYSYLDISRQLDIPRNAVAGVVDRAKKGEYGDEFQALGQAAARRAQDERDLVKFKQLNMIRLREQGLSYAEIGRRLGVAPQNVHMFLNK